MSGAGRDRRHRGGSGRWLQWGAICRRLGPCGGGHFEDLERKVGEEARAAADRHERLSGRPRPPSADRPDGQEPASRNFWWRGECHVMPRGQVTKAVHRLWPMPDRSDTIAGFQTAVWGAKPPTAEAISTHRRHVNAYFAEGKLPFSMTIETAADRVRLQEVDGG